METVIGTAIGIIISGFITFLITRWYIHRPKLCFRLEQAAMLFPEDFGPNLELRFQENPVTNLVILTLEVSHRGHADIVVPDAGNPQSPNRPLQPSFDFDNLSVFEIRTVNNDQSRFYIALCKANYSHRIFVNIHRIRAGTTARFQIVATFTANPATINPSQVHFFPGTIPNIDIVTQGAISRPWLKRQL